jgi:AraC family transcriptional regulator of adaptative response/methylated-DNA-[protein]-cysteine methyltransferase
VVERHQEGISAMKPINDDQRWQAVLARDRSADGTFVTAVSSTGIYCRPSCPARHPQRENVVFYDNPAAAERDGYRACRRCEPNASTDSQIALVQDVCRYLETHTDETITLDTLGKQFHVSPAHLGRIFKQAVGVTPRAYLESQRASRLKVELRNGDSVTDAQYEAGYGSSRALYEGAPLGMTPGVYRKGGAGLTVYYTIAEYKRPFGMVLVAATERGVCAVCLGDSVDALESGLRAELPAADLQLDDERLGETVQVVLRYLSGQERGLSLPLDVQATAFQRRVWEALRAIPYGETRAYGEVAAAIGNPRAARAVAQACATNPAALVIPCHRVIESDGGLGGYKWGIERKRALLEQEALTPVPSPVGR